MELTSSNIQDHAQGLITQYKIEQHSLFSGLANKTLTNEQIQKIALEIYQVVLVFPRFLSAILTKIEDYQLRMDLVANLYEEHGNMKKEKVHSETYVGFLKKIGVNTTEIESSKPQLPSIVYTRSILDLCLHQDPIQGLAALAVIEEIVARVSVYVSQFAKTFDIESSKKIDHFSDHETLDLTHSKEIYDLVALFICSKQNTQSVEQIKKSILLGLELGCYYQNRLYDDVISYANKIK